MTITRIPRLGANLWLLLSGLAFVRTVPFHLSWAQYGSNNNNNLFRGHREKSSAPMVNYSVSDDDGSLLVLPLVLQSYNATDLTIHLLEDDVQPKAPTIVFYQTGSSEADLPVCGRREMCSKVDVYGEPWIERMCRCSSGRTCSSSLDTDDGHTIIVDEARQFKTCEKVAELPKCQYFKEATWRIVQNVGPNNRSVHEASCTCPRDSITYLQWKGIKNSVFNFVCSPQRVPQCKKKMPCRLFTVKKKRADDREIEDVNATTICQCDKGSYCPKRHTDEGSTLAEKTRQSPPGKSIPERKDYIVYRSDCQQDDSAVMGSPIPAMAWDV